MTEINWDSWKFLLDLTQWGGMLLISAWVFIDKGRSQNSQAIREVSEYQAHLDKRIARLESQAATHEDLAKLTVEMEGLKSTLTRLTVTTDRIHDYLLNKQY